MFGQRLLLLIAFLATVVVLGCWDNKREMERVLGQGYDAVGQITGAQYQRKMPFAADGWRPRFVEQDISIDLKWPGKDGKEHELKKVPVTESFARSVVSGDQVRLMPVGIKALDDAQSVPVITLDAAQRLASLDAWRTASGAIAVAGYLGFAGIALWRRRAGAMGRRLSFADLPPKRSLAGAGLLLVGAMVAYQAWTTATAAEAARSEGIEITAEIVALSDTVGGGHAVQLAWKDALGAVHHYGPVPISATFYGEITTDGKLSVRETRVRYRPDEPQKRPVIEADAAGPGLIDRFGLAGGLVLMALGAGCLFSAFRAIGRP